MDYSKIGVITPYAVQKTCISRVIPHHMGSADVEVETISNFQGREKDIIIFSTTKTQSLTSFMVDPRRLNVALTRARRGIFIIGNASLLRSEEFTGAKRAMMGSQALKKYVDSLEKSGCIYRMEQEEDTAEREGN